MRDIRLQNKKRNYALFVLLFVVTVTVYVNALGNGFVTDDHDTIVNYSLIRDYRNIPTFFTSQDTLQNGEPTGYYRPLARLSFMLDYYLWGYNPLGYHLVNILLHGATVVAFFATLLLLYPYGISFVAALLFALHPIHVEAVTWITGRNNIVSALFIILAFYSYVVYDRGNDVGKRRLHYCLSLLFFLLALFVKEFALLFPLLIGLYHLCFCRVQAEGEKGNAGFLLRRFMPFLLPMGLYLYARHLVVGAPHGISIAALPENCLLSLKNFFTYIHVLLFPVELKMTYFIPSQEPFFNIRGVLALITLSLAVAGSIFLIRRERRLFFPIGVAFLFLLPVSGIVSFSQVPVAERYAYLPSMGFCLLLALCFERIMDRHRKTVILVVALLVAFYSYKVITRNQEWKDDLTVAISTVRSMPDSPVALYYLGNAYGAQGMTEAAVKAYKKSIALNAEFPHSHLALALLYQKIGRLDEAITEYRRVTEIMGDNEEAHSNLAYIYFQRGMIGEAIKEAEESLRINPADEAMQRNLVSLREEMRLRKELPDRGGPVSH